MSTVENWPGRGYYRGNKNALLADVQRLGIVPTPPDNRRMPPEEGHDDAMRPLPKVPPGGIGTWVRPPLDSVAGVGERIATTDIGPAKMSRTTAAALGYTGDACDHCGSMKMVQTGHCQTCQDCATTTGCS